MKQKIGNIVFVLVTALVSIMMSAGFSGAQVNSVPGPAVRDYQGASYVNTEGLKPTYSVASQVVAASSATDVIYITGSATKTIKITRINIGGRATSAVSADVSIVKRSTADSGGTCTAGTAIPHDSTLGAATATIGVCTANPTLGTAVGTLREKQVFLGNLTTGAPGADAQFLQGDRSAQEFTLRGAAQTIGINLNAGTYSGNLINFDIEWTEE